MNNPFEGSESAYAPMFLDAIELSGVRKNGATFRTALKACVFPAERCDPFNEVQEDSLLMKVSVCIPFDAALSCSPQIGDTLALADGSAWKVTDVKETQSWYEVEGRA